VQGAAGDDGQAPAAPTRQKLLSLYRKLHGHFGHRKWWPGESPLEVAVGAVLTQNTAWRNVEKALANLKADCGGALTSAYLLATPEPTLAELIRPSGYYNQKAKKLHGLARFIEDALGGDVTRLAALRLPRARELLLGLWGVGPETADSILLYGAGLPVFVIDAYTLRAGTRLGILPPPLVSGGSAAYAAAQQVFMGRLPPDGALYNDFHAQWVALGATYCRPRPLCPDCPLLSVCPTGRKV
jgi:endonuclease III related protein